MQQLDVFKKLDLLDHFVGERELHWRSVEPKRLRGLEVDHQLAWD